MTHCSRSTSSIRKPLNSPALIPVSAASQQKDFSGSLAVVMMRWTSSSVKKLGVGYKARVKLRSG
jgi:hypothetical protein